MAPIDEEAAEKVAKFRVGATIRCDVRQMRNYLFHRKWFALVNYAFGIWEETAPRLQYRGQDVRPSLDKFREDITILAGHCDAVFGVRGELMLRAKSISFASMSQEQFERLYSDTIDVILEKVLNRPDLSPESLREYVENVLRFD